MYVLRGEFTNLECANSIIDIYTATYSKNAVDVRFEGWVYGV
jgi:hypothetical protein